MKLFKKLIAAAAGLAYIFVVGYCSGILTDTATEFYTGLQQAPFLPPDAAFPIVWSIIYVLLGILVAVGVYRPELRKSLLLLGGLGALNILWCATFFVWQSPLAALGILAVQLVVVLVLTGFYIRNTPWLWLAMIPVAAWYVYAFLLNYAVVLLN